MLSLTHLCQQPSSGARIHVDSQSRTRAYQGTPLPGPGHDRVGAQHWAGGALRWAAEARRVVGDFAHSRETCVGCGNQGAAWQPGAIGPDANRSVGDLAWSPARAVGASLRHVTKPKASACCRTGAQYHAEGTLFGARPCRLSYHTRTHWRRGRCTGIDVKLLVSEARQLRWARRVGHYAQMIGGDRPAQNRMVGIACKRGVDND